jgi:hypothetical protein
MAVTIAAIVFDLLLVAFGAWVVYEGNPYIARWPERRYRVYTNQACFIISGGILAWMMFIMGGLALAPEAPISDNFDVPFFTMPFATWIGALLQILANFGHRLWRRRAA